MLEHKMQGFTCIKKFLIYKVWKICVKIYETNEKLYRSRNMPLTGIW
jgi:hypothetical protein